VPAVNPLVMSLVLVLGWGGFLLGLVRRVSRLCPTGQRLVWPNQLGRRLGRVLIEGVLQRRLLEYPLTGVLHALVFAGFLVLLPRSVILFGRGFDPEFPYGWLSGSTPLLGRMLLAYGWLKDLALVWVLLAVLGLFAIRLGARPRRLTHSLEALAILGTIAVMMLGDAVYDVGIEGLRQAVTRHCGAAPSPDFCFPAEALIAPLLAGKGAEVVPLAHLLTPAVTKLLSPDALVFLAQAGFWLHVLLVLAFLNALFFTKHQHILTALVHVFLSPTPDVGKPRPLAADQESLLARVEQAMDAPRGAAVAVGLSCLEELGFAERLGLTSCTECGRCSDNCPADLTKKPLSPKRVVMQLRDKLLANPEGLAEPLVPAVLTPEEIWACTNCRACDTRCPVRIRPSATLLELRRNLVLMRGEIPPARARVCESLEVHGNPWNLPRADRSGWMRELSIPRLAEVKRVDVLLWAGCAASYDARAGRVARSLVRLLMRAALDFAVLGDEESCTGDLARVMGNEYLFLALVERNVALLNRYQAEGRFARIVTLCPHCAGSLGHEYADFGGSYRVMHHSQLLAELIAAGRLSTASRRGLSVAFHDPCTLARNLGVVDAPRTVLSGAGLAPCREPKRHGLHTSCCGAGGGGMWDEETGDERMADQRLAQLSRTGAKAFATGCPFCLTQLTDAAVTSASTAPVRDIAEWLAEGLGLPTD